MTVVTRYQLHSVLHTLKDARPIKPTHASRLPPVQKIKTHRITQTHKKTKRQCAEVTDPRLNASGPVPDRPFHPHAVRACVLQRGADTHAFLLAASNSNPTARSNYIKEMRNANTIIAIKWLISNLMKHDGMLSKLSLSIML